MTSTHLDTMTILCAPTNLYFLIEWCDDTEDVMYDATPAKDITPSENEDVLDLPGDECKASFANTLYTAKVVAVGE